MPTQLVRALALGINGNPFAALGPHDTRAGRIIRAFLPSATKVELLRRPDGASRRTRAACWVGGGKKSKALWRVMWEVCECGSEADKVDPFSARYGVTGDDFEPQHNVVRHGFGGFGAQPNAGGGYLVLLQE